MMKQEDLFRKLGLILNELNEQYQFLAQNPQQLNELELELFHANANFLADHVQIIKKISLGQQAPIALAPASENQEIAENITEAEGDNIQDEQQVEEITFEDQIKDSEPIIEEKQTPNFEEIEAEVFKLDDEPAKFEFILNDHSEYETTEDVGEMDNRQFSLDSFIHEENSNADEKFDFEEKSVDEIFNRPLSEEEERILAQKKKLREDPIEEIIDTDEDEIGPEPFLVKKNEDFIITPNDLKLEEAPTLEVTLDKSELVEDPNFKPTLNDLLANRSAANLNSTSTTGITDLKQAINLNDKLLYIKDLFNGYNLAYAEAIDLANKLPNFEAADNFFKNNYAVKNNWAEKQTTVDKFYELLNQRFK
ncbi:hypothetical protein [Pedobacter boryungensis]|uniref:Uncharacterized protein n=1 Tax=Pedobacter boryungensis TaxID=869962 RepID=A0ABX2DEA4_9SPHI|nr:hypothetical protein [Pedobacter boryungensis]NQX32320.1 hypothetical protein [Pedobacter boryungensis]